MSPACRQPTDLIHGEWKEVFAGSDQPSSPSPPGQCGWPMLSFFFNKTKQSKTIQTKPNQTKPLSADTVLDLWLASKHLPTHILKFSKCLTISGMYIMYYDYIHPHYSLIPHPFTLWNPLLSILSIMVFSKFSFVYVQVLNWLRPCLWDHECNIHAMRTNIP